MNEQNKKFDFLLESVEKVVKRLNEIESSEATTNSRKNLTSTEPSMLGKPKSILVEDNDENAPVKSQIPQKPVPKPSSVSDSGCESTTLSAVQRFIHGHPEKSKHVAKIIKKVQFSDHRHTKKSTSDDGSCILTDTLTLQRKQFHQSPRNVFTSTIDDSLKELGKIQLFDSESVEVLILGLYSPPSKGSRSHTRQHQNIPPLLSHESTYSLDEIDLNLPHSSDSGKPTTASAKRGQLAPSETISNRFVTTSITQVADKFSDDELFDCMFNSLFTWTSTN